MAPTRRLVGKSLVSGGFEPSIAQKASLEQSQKDIQKPKWDSRVAFALHLSSHSRLFGSFVIIVPLYGPKKAAGRLSVKAPIVAFDTVAICKSAF